MIIPEQQLWRAVITRAFLDLIEEDGKRADHKWFRSYGFHDVCGMAGIDTDHVLYIYSLITRSPNIKKSSIILLLNKYQLLKEKDDIQEQHQSDI
jgi:hypothetical protein